MCRDLLAIVPESGYSRMQGFANGPEILAIRPFRPSDERRIERIPALGILDLENP
jgi:hypothetical protein